MSHDNDQGACSHHIVNHLSVSDHVRDVTSKCSQTHALKVLRCHGMNDEALRQVLQSSRHRQASVRIASLVEYTTAADKERFEAFI